MGRNEIIGRPDVKRVFPDLTPQSELDQRSVPARYGSKNLWTWWKHDGPMEVLAPAQEKVLNSNKKTVPELDATVLSIRNLHEHGDLFVRYMRARRDVFIVQKGWNLAEVDGMEFDQYDTPLARWIVVEAENKVVGGARISPTTAACGNHSYMLRDAQLGLLPGLAHDLLFEPAPVKKEVWEATRLFVTDAVPSDQRLVVQKRLMKEMAVAIRSVGATHAIGIVPAIFKRWLKRIGMTATEVGPITVIDGDRVQAALMAADDYRPNDSD